MKARIPGRPKNLHRFVLILLAPLVGSLGCGAPETDRSETVTGALGSVWTQPQNINNWTDLTQMVAGGSYLLTANIDAAGKTWTPKAFSGTFDGGNKTISNLAINVSGNTEVGFFSTLTRAIVRNVRFTNLTVTGHYMVGGVAGTAEDSLLEMVGVEGTINASGGVGAGGLIGVGGGNTINRSFMKGSVNSSRSYAGGLTGSLNAGAAGGTIFQSYAWVTIAPDTSDASRPVWAGGIVGWMLGSKVQDVYAVGTVTGRAHAGGLVGGVQCVPGYVYVINHGVWRGEVIDKNRSAQSGWAGTFGTYEDCSTRFDQLIWDRTLDRSTTAGVGPTPDAQKSATTQDLMSQTSVDSGPYYFPDNKFDGQYWDPGNASQNHALKNMPGGLTIQPRCVTNGVPSAC